MSRREAILCDKDVKLSQLQCQGEQFIGCEMDLITLGHFQHTSATDGRRIIEETYGPGSEAPEEHDVS